MSAAAHGAEAVGPVETAVHRLAPQCKVAALLAFVVAVALVPYREAWPYAIDAVLLSVVAIASRTAASLLGHRLVVEIPFAGTDWLVREVLKEAGDAAVLEPPDAREAVRAAAAGLQ